MKTYIAVYRNADPPLLMQAEDILEAVNFAEHFRAQKDEIISVGLA